MSNAQFLASTLFSNMKYLRLFPSNLISKTEKNNKNIRLFSFCKLAFLSAQACQCNNENQHNSTNERHWDDHDYRGVDALFPVMKIIHK